MPPAEKPNVTPPPGGKRLTPFPLILTFEPMEVFLSTELQAKLTRLAAQQGRDSSALVAQAVERMVECDEWFLAEVKKGLAQAEQGKTLSHDEVGARIDSYLASKQHT
jgi:RHH-type rel operon transcriptional repressor/antitoxin RelB